MPKAYWIGHVDVKDADTYGQYAVIATEAIESHGGVFLARSGRYRQLEGKDRARNVVAVFPSFEDAAPAMTARAIRKPASSPNGLRNAT